MVGLEIAVGVAVLAGMAGLLRLAEFKTAATLIVRRLRH